MQSFSGPVFSYDSYCYSLTWPINLGRVQHCEDLAGAIIALVGASVRTPGAVRVIFDVEDVYESVPDRLSVMSLMYQHRLHKCGFAAVLTFYGVFEFGARYFTRNKFHGGQADTQREEGDSFQLAAPSFATRVMICPRCQISISCSWQSMRA